MITIADAADQIGEYIGRQAGLQSEVKKICYGVECLLVMSLSIGIITGLGWLCGVFAETALITLTALLMKYIIGGPHLSGFLRCTGFSAFIFISSAWLLKAGGNSLHWWIIILAFFGCGAILLYRPLLAPECNSGIKQTRLRKFLCVLLLMLLCGLNYGYRNLGSISLLTGAILTILLRTPIGILIVQRVEQITKGKEVQLK